MRVILVFVGSLLKIVSGGQIFFFSLQWRHFERYALRRCLLGVSLSWAVSSVGRAPHLQCGGQEFESPTVHGVKWLFSELFFCFFLQGCLETDKEIPLLGAILVRKSEMRYFEMIDFDIVR